MSQQEELHEPLRRENDNTIYGWRCKKCGYFWKLYQKSCACAGRVKYEDEEEN